MRSGLGAVVLLEPVTVGELVPAYLLAGPAKLAGDLLLGGALVALGEDRAPEDGLPAPADLPGGRLGALFRFLVGGEGFHYVGHVGWHSCMVARQLAASPVCHVATWMRCHHATCIVGVVLFDREEEPGERLHLREL